MICKLVYEKDGLTGLKRLMNYTSYKEIFDKEFNVRNEGINNFLRMAVSEQSNR
ncbi:MAG: hypothetical protein JWR76_1023 [Mucilaginibacter sp.]|nr:hypothetical protein [Mucilaginibacter sp.]